MIRKINKHDVLAINAILVDTNYKITQSYLDNPFFRCVVYENDFIKGALIFQHIYNRIEIDYIVVREDYRNNHIASNLMEYLISYAIKNNVDNITLEVNENNSIAIKLYKKYRFEMISKRKNYYGKADAILMIRKFDNNE